MFFLCLKRRDRISVLKTKLSIYFKQYIKQIADYRTNNTSQLQLENKAPFCRLHSHRDNEDFPVIPRFSCFAKCNGDGATCECDNELRGGIRRNRLCLYTAVIEDWGIIGWSQILLLTHVWLVWGTEVAFDLAKEDGM